MSQIDLTKIRNYTFKYAGYFIMIFLAFLLVLKRAEVAGLQLAVEQQKEKANLSIKKSKILLSQANDLKKKGVKLKENISFLKKDSIQSDIKIRNLNISLKMKLAEIKKYKVNDIALYLQKRYDVNKGIVITKYGVAMNDTLAKKNISELIACDEAKNEMKIVKGDLQTKNKIIKGQDELINNIEQQNNALNLSVVEINKAFESSEAISKANEKMYKKEKVKKTFWQALTGTVIVGASFLLFTN